MRMQPRDELVLIADELVWTIHLLEQEESERLQKRLAALARAYDEARKRLYE